MQRADDLRQQCPEFNMVVVVRTALGGRWKGKVDVKNHGPLFIVGLRWALLRVIKGI